MMKRNIKTTAAEIERFLGASIFVSCVGYLRLCMYWQRSLQLPLVCEAMTRDRYFRIRSSLKVVVDVDVSDDAKKADRLWKVRPLVDRIRSGCLKLARPRDVSIDEQMIPFSCHSALRQYVPNKPKPALQKVHGSRHYLWSRNGVLKHWLRGWHRKQ